MNIASLRLGVVLRVVAWAAPFGQLACSEPPLGSASLPSEEPSSTPTPTSEASEEDRSEAEPTAAPAADGVDAAAPATRQKPVDGSTAVAPIAREPTALSPADAAQVAASSAPEAAASDAATPSVADAGARTDAGAEADIIDEAFAALTLGRKDKIPKLIEALDERVKRQPDDGMAVFYSGAIRFWKLTEGSDGVLSLLQNLSLPEEILSRFARASVLLPDDFRIPGFYGLAQTNVGMLTGDAALTKAGLLTLDDAIARYPAYGYFLRASATASASVDDPLFATTLSDMEGIFRECLIERSDGEVTYTYPRGPKLAARPHICLNDSIIPHVWEGTLISFADMALKAGWDAQKVRALYRSARTSPNYADWPFAAKLEARIEAAEEHVRLIADGNPLNDPLAWGLEGNLCSGCHRER